MISNRLVTVDQLVMVYFNNTSKETWKFLKFNALINYMAFYLHKCSHSNRHCRIFMFMMFSVNDSSSKPYPVNRKPQKSGVEKQKGQKDEENNSIAEHGLNFFETLSKRYAQVSMNVVRLKLVDAVFECSKLRGQA